MAEMMEDSRAEPRLEERVFKSLVSGESVAQSEEWLRELGEVDARSATGGKTLLHVAVELGKLDWVERMLRMGADPGVRDTCGRTALEKAEEERSQAPEDADRGLILKLVTLVHSRDAVKLPSVDGRAEAGVAVNSSEDAPGGALKEGPGAVSLSSSSGEVRDGTAWQLLLLREAVDEVRRELTSRDVLLEKLESSITSLVEGQGGGQRDSGDHARDIVPDRDRSLVVDVMVKKTVVSEPNEEKMKRVRKIYEGIYDAGVLTSCLLSFLMRQLGVRIFIDCESQNLKGLRKRFRDHDGSKCDGGDCIAFADFQGKSVYLAGKLLSIQVMSGYLAGSLAQMSAYLAFQNGGRPYGEEDEVHERMYEDIVKDVVGMQGNTWELPAPKRSPAAVFGSATNCEAFTSVVKKVMPQLSNHVIRALGKKNEIGKEIYLISSIPQQIVENGSMEKTLVQNNVLPSLLLFYEYHMVSTLVSKSRV